MCVTTLSKSTCASRSSGAWRFTCSRKALSVLGFGMDSSQDGVVQSLVSSSAGVAPSVASSASCYDTSEQVRVFPVVVSEGELGEVERQVLLADLMVVTDYAALQQTPEVIERVGVDRPAHVFTFRVGDHLMRIPLAEFLVAEPFVGGDEINLVAHRLLDEIAERPFVGVLNHFADHVTLAGNRAHDTDFPCPARHVRLLIPMAVLVFPTDEGLVHFNRAHQFVPRSVLHRGTDAMAHVPRSAVRSHAEHPLNLKGAGALLALRHDEDNLEPVGQRVLGVLEDGLGDNGEPIAVLVAGLANPMEGTVCDVPYLHVSALGTGDAVWPAAFHQVPLAGLVIGELGEQLIECHALNMAPLGLGVK